MGTQDVESEQFDGYFQFEGVNPADGSPVYMKHAYFKSFSSVTRLLLWRDASTVAITPQEPSFYVSVSALDLSVFPPAHRTRSQGPLRLPLEEAHTPRMSRRPSRGLSCVCSHQSNGLESCSTFGEFDEGKNLLRSLDSALASGIEMPAFIRQKSRSCQPSLRKAMSRIRTGEPLSADVGHKASDHNVFYPSLQIQYLR